MILNGSAQMLLNLKTTPNNPLKSNQLQKKTRYGKCNKPITALHFVQYCVLFSSEKQYSLWLSDMDNVAFQWCITHQSYCTQ